MVDLKELGVEMGNEGKTITDIDGVYASGIHAGIKYKKKDLGFIYVPKAFSSAGVFTTKITGTS